MKIITLLVTICALMSISLTSIASEEAPIPTHSFRCISDQYGGLNYVNGVKQCKYYCNNPCVGSIQIIGDSAKYGDGSYNCFGAITAVQPSMNGQLSTNTVGYRHFRVTLRGFYSYYSAWSYGSVFDQLNAAYEAKSCEQ